MKGTEKCSLNVSVFTSKIFEKKGNTVLGYNIIFSSFGYN